MTFPFVTTIMKAVDVFLEELIVRRELADNFCFYQPQYDSLKGAWEWARKTLMDHASDKREHIYTSVNSLIIFAIIYFMDRFLSLCADSIC